MAKNIRNVVPFLLVCVFLLTAFIAMPGKKSGSKLLIYNYLNHTNSSVYNYLPRKDTFYVLGDNFIELNLDEQIAILRRRGDTSITYKISSGNEKIHKGMKTTEGIFTVQSKCPLAHSRQFNNAALWYWIGFNYNIGFHGLAGSSYHRHLGVRPSSHGCVRISREDGKDLYKKIQIGTPVIVYEGESARVLAFAEKSDYKPGRGILLMKNSKFQKEFIRQRLADFYSGEANAHCGTKIFFDGETQLRNGGFDCGEAGKIAFRQKTNIAGFKYFPARGDNLKFQSGNYVLMETDSVKTKNQE